MRVAVALVKLAGQIVILLAPLLTAQWSLLNWLAHSEAKATDVITLSVLGWTTTGAKDELELKLRACAVVLAAGVVLASDFLEKAFALSSLEKFRKVYLDNEYERNWKRQLGSGIRVNVMFAKRRLYLAGLRRFTWAWSKGFTPPTAHVDANLWLTELQGVCGRALRGRVAKAAYFDGLPEPTGFLEKWCFCNKFRLSRRQLRRTRHIKAILSIPIFLPSDGPSPSHKVVGVINLDALSDPAAKKLKKNEQVLVDYFAGVGMAVALVRG